MESILDTDDNEELNENISEIKINKKEDVNKQFNHIYETSLKLFYKYFNDELNNIIYNHDKYGWVTLKSSSLGSYIQELQSFIPSKNSYEHDDLITLHYIARAFVDYNEKYLNLHSSINFNKKIFYPNIVYIMIKYLYHGHKFIYKLLDEVFNYYKTKYTTIVNKFINSYFYDEDLIKINIFYKFLNEQMKNINPDTIGNIQAFYRNVIFNDYSYFFRQKIDVNAIYGTSLENDEHLQYSGLNTTQLGRFNLYKKILYNIKIEKLAKYSPIQSQLSYNFDIFKNIIIPNEFQDVLYNSLVNSKNIYIDNKKFKVMNMYTTRSKLNDILHQIKEETPAIYKLLKCIHIISNGNNTSSYNKNIIKVEEVKNNVYEELYTIFGGSYCDSYIRNILENIAENFAKNILSGEYINLLTLNTFKIHTITFKQQLRKFIKMCIETYITGEKYYGKR